MQAQRHIKDGFGLPQNIWWQTRFESEKFGISKNRGKGVVDVMAHLSDVSSQGRLGLRRLASYFSIAGTRPQLECAEEARAQAMPP